MDDVTITYEPAAADVLRDRLNRMHETFVQHGVPGYADDNVFPPTTPVIRYEDGTEVYGPLARKRAAETGNKES